MDTGNMTFGETLFHARWGIIGGVMFLVFMVAFLREVARELALAVAERRRNERRHALGLFTADPLLGATMTDGGEPVEDGKAGGGEPGTDAER